MDCNRQKYSQIEKLNKSLEGQTFTWKECCPTTRYLFQAHQCYLTVWKGCEVN